MSIIEAEQRATPVSVTVNVGGKDITFETGKLAKQADGAVVVRSGDTMVLATAQGRTEAREGADFFPLTVDVEERMYAAGKIPGGFFKREGRPTERAILTARMIDRPIRPLWPKGYRNEVQCIATVLSADMVVPHDILAINGVSAALMISPMPFLGPIGAVRIGLVEGELVVNPTLQETEEIDARPDRRRHEGRADDGRGRRRPGARGRAPRGARPRPARDREALRGAGGAPREGRQAEVARPRRDAPDRRAVRRRDRRRGSSEQGLREAAAIVDEIVEREGGKLSMESSEDDVTRELQTRMALATVLEKQRTAAVTGPVREQFENDLRALTDAEQDSKELKSAKQHLLYDRIVETVGLPFPVGPARRRRAGREGRADEGVRQEGRRGDLQGPRPPQDRGRQAPAGRPLGGADPRDRVRGHGQPAHARLGPLHPRPDADHDALHARHREGGAADRRPLARVGPPLHAPLQLPALLGRRDGPHERPAPARHRPRRARPAGARGGAPARVGVPVHDPARLRDARVERLVVDGLGVRLDPRADGRGRADHGARLRDRDGPRQGGRRLRHPHRHPGCRGPPRRHGLQGRRHPRGDHGAADGHQDHRRLAGDHGAGARAGEGRARGDPRPDARARSRSRGRSSPATRRGSRPCRSTPSTSAW